MKSAWCSWSPLATGGAPDAGTPPLTVFCEIEVKTWRSRRRFEPFLLLERFQKRQNEKCSTIWGRDLFWGLWDVEKVVKKHR